MDVIGQGFTAAEGDLLEEDDDTLSYDVLLNADGSEAEEDSID